MINDILIRVLSFIRLIMLIMASVMLFIAGCFYTAKLKQNMLITNVNFRMGKSYVGNI
jgi:hypothetical protein